MRYFRNNPDHDRRIVRDIALRIKEKENWLGWQGPQPIHDQAKSLIFLECNRRLHIQLLQPFGTPRKMFEVGWGCACPWSRDATIPSLVSLFGLVKAMHVILACLSEDDPTSAKLW